MIVLKFGGTSVGKVENIIQVARLINNDTRKIVVLSAMSGITDKLYEISYYHKLNQLVSANEVIEVVRTRFYSTAELLLTDTKMFDKFIRILDEKIIAINALIHNDYTEIIKNELIIQGELITSELVQVYLEQQKITSVLLNAVNFMSVNADREPNYMNIESRLKEELKKHEDAKLFITQGFVCLNHKGEIDNLNRSGSDFTATIIGSVINAVEIQIWSDIDGMHNNDPRFVDNTKCIQNMSYQEAEELAYFGAKVLHPTCIYPAKVKGIPVLLKNTLRPESTGTLISTITEKVGIKAIAAKDKITAIRIQSGRMLLAFGFLSRIFEIFNQFQTPVDMITTSEVSISVTIDNTSNLDNIVKELQKVGEVEVVPDQTLICLVGNLGAETKGELSRILIALKDIPIRMVSYGSNSNNVTLLVNSEHKKQALQDLHTNLFNN